MSGFKRFVSFIFALAGLLALAALILPWVGPWQDLFTDLISNNSAWLLGVEICAGICAVGLLALLLRAIVARAPKNIVVTSVAGDEITVTREAIASQAAHLIEMDGTCQADRVNVKTKRGNVFVRARVLPYESLDIVAKGAELHKRLTEGLVAVCGEHVASVNLEFVEPATVRVPATQTFSDAEPEPPASPSPSAHVDAAPEAGAPTNSEITLSMPSGTPLSENLEADADSSLTEANE